MKYRVYTVVYVDRIKTHLILADALIDSKNNPEGYFVPGWKSWHEEGYVMMALTRKGCIVPEIELDIHYVSE